jgi:nitroimidazol reductase NimA-like FMN-containing flavoprotein (pyridoxamine 5'-phosphate oxidase superfamily)
VRRRPDRARYERAEVAAILDEAFVCHVGLIDDDGAPVVIPMVYGRAGDTLYLHGSPASRLLEQLPRGARACATVTLVDGVVLARSARKHSLNYRSVVAFGAVRTVSDLAEKHAALDAVVDHLLRGRSDEVRAPTRGDLSSTNVVAFAIEEAAAKSRTGPPVEDEDDRSLPIWAGEVPLTVTAATPVCDPPSAELPLPASVVGLISDRAAPSASPTSPPGTGTG